MFDCYCYLLKLFQRIPMFSISFFWSVFSWNILFHISLFFKRNACNSALLSRSYVYIHIQLPNINAPNIKQSAEDTTNYLYIYIAYPK